MAQSISSFRMGQFKQKRYDKKRGRKPPPLKTKKIKEPTAKIPKVDTSELKRLDNAPSRVVTNTSTNKTRSGGLSLSGNKNRVALKKRAGFTDYVTLGLDLMEDIFDQGWGGVRRRLKTFKEDFK